VISLWNSPVLENAWRLPDQPKEHLRRRLDYDGGRWSYLACVFFFFACVFMDLDFISVHKHAKKNLAISSHVDRTSLVNNSYIKYYRAQTKILINQTKSNVWLPKGWQSNEIKHSIIKWSKVVVNQTCDYWTPVCLINKLRSFDLMIWVKFVKIPKQKFESQLRALKLCSVLW